MPTLFRHRLPGRHEDEPDPQPLVAAVPTLLNDGKLLAQWYMLYRLEEEVERARRYGRPLAVVVATPALLPGEQLSEQLSDAGIEAALKVVRKTDLLGRLDAGGLLMIMPETSLQGAEAAASRWRSELFLRTRWAGGQKWLVRGRAFRKELPSAAALLASALEQAAA
jgi:hypothetical protein